MPTISTTIRSETRSIAIDVTPDAVLDLVADPRRLPSWAPDFASSVHPEGDDWLIERAGAAAGRITVRVCRERGTVDLLSASDHDRGAFSRVLPNGGGSEYLFTLFFPDGTAESAVEAQMTIVEAELRRVRDLCEHR